MATLLLTIGTPQDNDWAKTSPPGQLTVSGTASLTDVPTGAVDVTITVGADSYVPTDGTRKFVQWSQTLTPPAGWDLKVNVSAAGSWSTGGSGGTTEHSVNTSKTVTLRADNTAPALTVSSPANGAHFAGSAQGFAVPMSGTVTDQESGVLWLTWTGEDGSSGPIAVGAAGSWQATVALTPGPHVVTFTAEDRVGNTSTVSLQVQVDAPSDIFGTTAQDYLHALLEFATQPADRTGAVSRVAVAGANLTTADLEAALYQPFTALADASNAGKASEEISRVRMAIEVLRQYLLAHPVTDAQAQSRLAAAELQYRTTAYFALLQQIGTSFDEIRLIRTAAEADRKAVADRLGITLRTSRPDECDSLLLDPASLSESSLETLFGLVDTTRDPLDDGVRVSDVKWLTGWNFTGVNPGRNTDADGFVYLNMNPVLVVRQPPGTFRVGVSTQAHGGLQVALGTADPNLTVVLGAVQNSGLGGRLRFLKPPTEQIQMSVAPSVLTWQANHLRDSWKLQDLGPGQVAAPPVIDPDLLAIGDFLNPNTSDAAFALYLERQNMVQAWSQVLQSKRPDLNALIAGVLIDADHSGGWTVSDLLSLDQSRAGGRDISADLSNLDLDVDAFDRLVTIGRIYTSAGTAQLLESEWTDVVSILIQVQKRQEYPAWRAKEATVAHGVTLSPDWFVADTSAEDAPDLPKWRATARARSTLVRVLQGRRQQRNSISEALRQAVEAVEGMALPMLRDALVDAVQVPMTIDRVYGTGLDPDGRTLVDGAVDPHWAITSGPSLSGTAPTFATVSSYPVGNPWIANDANSRWISPHPNEQSGDAAGGYVYSTAFDLTGFDPPTARIVASVAVDDAITQVRLNGGNLNLTATGFAAFTVLNIAQGFVDGRNVLEFDVSNGGTTINPTGLRVQIAASGTYRPGADWLSERLLLDVGATLQRTTRLAQATETMQQLFFVLRSQGFAALPELSSWTLNAWTLADPAPPFDAEWNWMGSYSTWTAAMNVFLFPENILLPSLRFGSGIWPPTQAFQDLVASVRDASPLTPDGVRPLVAAYLAALQTTSRYPDLPQELRSASLSTADLADNPSDDQLKTRANQLTQWWRNYQNEAPPSQKHINYLAEVFFFVPLHLALQLQQAGQFASALEWYRKIYAISLPAARRKVWYGLVAEESVPIVYQQVSLASSLNPHDIVGFNPGSVVSQVVGNRARAYSRFTLISLVRCLLDFADSEFAIDSAESLPRARSLYLQALDLLGAPDLQRLPGAEDRIPANELLASLEQHATLNLAKLRSGRNFSGLLRSGAADLQPSTGAPVQPTQYRYATLVDRARQLCALAQQAESSFLASLEKADAETYTALKANQDLEVANANVVLQKLATSEAMASTDLAVDQSSRAQIQIDHYTDLLASDISGLEMASIGMHIGEAANQGLAAGLYGAIASRDVAKAVTTQGFSEMVSAFFGSSGAAGAAAQAASATAQAFAASAGVLSALASYEEKQKDWHYELNLAGSDWFIARQQASIARDHEAVVRQQQTIATIQNRHASDVVTFLTTQKFTNAALYEWMSGILQQVYSYLLQQATSVARLAQTQLAFERQTPPLNIVQTYYWQAPSDTVAAPGSSGQPSDTRGLTGSARLLADITQLDQYAFATDQRKLQLTKSISLAQWDPFAFRTFQTTGVLRFTTTSRPFDQDFPGHYLRVIKRVRMSLIALVPALQGIHATLRHTGVSRVVVGGDSFSEIPLTREPQTVALTSPVNATGLFELDVQPELLLPFEGLGVAGSWEFVMPKAANQFDYGSIADLVISLDYTAFDSPDYRQQVIQQLGRSASADRAYSLRQDFADAWYELNNPLQSATPMKVVFESKRVDLPVNIDDGTLTLSQLLLYFVAAAGQTFTVQPTLTLDGTDGSGNPKTVSGAATTIDGVISTRRGNATALSAMIGMSPVGTWTLDLSNPDARQLFLTGQVADILFVVTYEGELPEWPA